MSQIETVKELHSQGKYEEAIEGYQKLLIEDPNNDEAHFGLAHASSRINQLEQALQHAIQAVNLAPNAYRYLQFKGQMHLANQQLDEALKAFNRSIKENPNLFHSYLAVGDIYTIRNEPQKAKKNYHLALKVHQDGIPATVKLARLLLIEGNYDQAENILQEAELQFPEDHTLKLQMGIMRLEQGELGFAELYFKKLIEDEPNNHIAKAYLSMCLVQSDPQEAHQYLNELLNNKVQIPELMIAVGFSCIHNGGFQDAIHYLAPICQSGLAYPSWLMALAQAYVNNRQPNSAIAVLNEVLMRGNNSRALLMLGQIHQANNNFKEALNTYQKIVQTSKDYHQSLLLQAECYYASNDYQTVIKHLEPILADKPDHNIAIKLQLKALSQLSEFDRAIKLIDSIDSEKQVAAFNQTMHLYAGLLLDEQQLYEQAWQHFSVIEPQDFPGIKLLSDEEEKTVQKFTANSDDTVFKFVLADPATGYQDFVSWSEDNNIIPLTDRITPSGRVDVFAEKWAVNMLHDLTETQLHFLRKKYTKQLQQIVNNEDKTIIDFIPLSPINMAIIKYVFPQTQVLILSRNFADLRLHHHVFDSQTVHYTQFSKVTNQMIAMNSNAILIDIDAWQNNDPITTDHIKKVFGDQVGAFTLAQANPLDRNIFPFMHWKNYQHQLND